MKRNRIESIWGGRPPVIGMVHLLPLPGAPGWGGSMTAVLERAAEDARALVGPAGEPGVDGLMIENYGDVPFFADNVPPETVAALTRAAVTVSTEVDVPFGINVLRNDALSALGIAAATGASFIRVNVLAGGMYTDQGWIEGRAAELVRARESLAPDVAVLADVLVKHATPPAGLSIEDAARDTWHRGGADVLIASGAGTGLPTDPDRLDALRAAVPDAPVWVGSGVTPETARKLAARADGFIVGSALQRDGRSGAAVERERVVKLLEAIRGSGD